MPFFRHSLGTIALATTLLAALPATSAQAAASYEVTRLTSPDFAAFGPQAIGDSGAIAGIIQTDRDNPYSVGAGIYQGGTLTRIAPSASDAVAAGVNAQGDTVGFYIEHGNHDQKAFAVIGGQFQTIGVPHHHAFARGINDAGQVIGTGVFEEPWSEQSAFIWQNGQLTQLSRDVGLEHGDYYGFSADGINEAGQVIVNVEGVDRHAYIWQDGVYTEIAAPEGHSQVLARSINDQGQVVGRTLWLDRPGDHLDHAFLYDRAGGLRILDTGEVDSEAVGINDLGDIVGHLIYDKARGEQAPFLYRDGRMTLLQDLIGPGDIRLLQVTGINDLGQIVGLGIGADGGPVGFLLTPVPEPGAVWLSGLGMLAVLALKRHRARRLLPAAPM